MFTDAHQAWWNAARRARGDGAGTRALIEVLLLHRHLDAEDVLGGIHATLKVGSTDPALVAIQARRLTDTPAAQVVPITRALGHHDRPPPTLAGYDSLLDPDTLAVVIPLGVRP